jgi:hypothetical protein
VAGLEQSHTLVVMVDSYMGYWHIEFVHIDRNISVVYCHRDQLMAIHKQWVVENYYTCFLVCFDSFAQQMTI